MSTSLAELGFEKTSHNPNGITIYHGTKDGEDWTIHIPASIIAKVLVPDRVIDAKAYVKLRNELLENGLTFYGITKHECYALAKKYSKIAEDSSNNLLYS